MSTTYSIEYAKSGRSSCKKCKSKIAKDELRIGVSSEAGDGDYTMTAWYHPKCYNVPRKLKDVSPEQFVHDHLEDGSDDASILPDKADEIIEAIASKVVTPKKDKKGSDSLMDQWKSEWEELNPKKSKKKRKADDDSEEEEKPANKKPKTSAGVELYGKYHTQNVDQLKDYLRWNRQVLKGTKAEVLHKVIDGEMNGRLPLCKVCDGGKLKFNDACTKVICGGNFDETTQMRIPCDVSYSLEDAPREQPWYTSEPTEEQTEAMKKSEAEIKGEEVEGAEPDADSALGKLLKAADDLELDLTDVKAIKMSAGKMVEFLEESDAQLDLPDEESKIRKAVGKIILENKESTPRELVQKIVQKFGFADKKAAKAAAKEEAVTASVACSENAALFLALKELSSLYFGEGNRNAGSSYMKAATAMKDLPFAVTEDNAKGLGKAGKNKVQNIGKSTADKLYEFITTGTIQKLEEKRANAA